MELEIEKWVEGALPGQESFRQAVHIVLKSISVSEYLKPHMIMKGGMLLGIRHKSGRYTKDIDFSTRLKIQDFDEETFRKELDEALIEAADELAYGLDCQVQSFKYKPKLKPNVQLTTPALMITIGYARKTDKDYKRFQNGHASHTIKIDYSFNESIPHPEELLIEDENISVYGVIDLVAEKLRSVLQQKKRNRTRRQDIFDLNFLLSLDGGFEDDEKLLILESLKSKSENRLDEGDLHKLALEDDVIYNLSKSEYEDMKDEIDGDLPDFDESYQRINDFYKSLPWDYA